MSQSSDSHTPIERRAVLKGGATAFGLGALAAGAQAAVQASSQAALSPKDDLKITKLETFLVKPRWLFLKIHTNAGLSAWANRFSKAAQKPAPRPWQEMAPYLIGKDPRRVVHHWQAIYRHAFLSRRPDADQRAERHRAGLWDITGKAMGVPIYELFGGPRATGAALRPRHSPETIKDAAQGFTAFKTGPGAGHRASSKPRDSSTGAPRSLPYCCEKPRGDDVDIGIDFHGAISPATAKTAHQGARALSADVHRRARQCQNHDIMAEIARGTHLPIATGERVFTKWGFREVLEKRAATILQPDICHAGGITETRLIAGMAEAYYAAIAPHNPLGPIAPAAGVHLAASIPNFLCQEHVSSARGISKSR